MLVLSRRKHETLLIGPDVTVTVLRIGPNSVRLGIEAPRHMGIIREEVGPYVHTPPAEACCDVEDEPEVDG